MSLNLYRRLRHGTYQFLDDHPFTSVWDAIISLSLMGLIIANVVAICLESMPGIFRQNRHFFDQFEKVSVYIFTAEYFFRLWSCVEEPRYRHPVGGRAKYLFSPLALSDLVSTLPYFLPALGLDLRFIRILRMFRIFRLAKLTRYSHAFRTLGCAIYRKKEELVAVLFLEAILLVIFSFSIFMVENPAQPRAFSSIPVALQWGVSCLLSIGTTKIHPITPIGNIIAGIVGVLGLGLFALPAGILSAAFLESYRRSPKSAHRILKRDHSRAA